MALSEKQKILIEFAYKNENKINKTQAVELIGNSYYCNENKHVGDILSRMVNSGLLTRIKNGHFEISKTKKQTTNGIINPNQLELL